MSNPTYDKGEREMNKKPVLWSLVSLLILLHAAFCLWGASNNCSNTSTSSNCSPCRNAGPRHSGCYHSSGSPRPPNCGTAPVVLNGYFETGFDLPFNLSTEFTKEYPNVTWNISQDQFANLDHLGAAPAGE